ncbi:MAG: hypothetical protein WAV25_02130 [Minisyncoccia bacterium]
MPTGTVLLKCRKCGQHGHWKYQDGSISVEFYCVSDGALAFLEALSAKKAEPGEVDKALNCLRNSGIAATQDEIKGLVNRLSQKFNITVETLVSDVRAAFSDEDTSKKGGNPPPIC